MELLFYCSSNPDNVPSGSEIFNTSLIFVNLSLDGTFIEEFEFLINSNNNNPNPESGTISRQRKYVHGFGTFKQCSTQVQINVRKLLFCNLWIKCNFSFYVTFPIYKITKANFQYRYCHQIVNDVLYNLP